MENQKKKIEKYQPSIIEEKWRKKWEEEKIYQPDLDTVKKPFYNLMMFPYPSAEGMHVGNMYAFTGSDIYGRYQRMKGNDVFEPIGLDGFGIHSENYAIKVGRHPMEQAKISQKNFYRQLRATGNAFDWSRTLETYNPNYYKWTQWIFLQLYKNGLAYRKKAPVNFCPSCKTVLADEQVINGKCERCNSIIERKELEQWFFKITAYAEKLLNNLEKLDWSEKVKIAQRNWIGRSEGTQIEFKVQPFDFTQDKNSKFKINIFTVFPETIFGVTYMVLAPENPLVASLLKSNIKDQKSKIDEINNYIEKSKKKTEQERIAEGKEKTGVFTGSYCVNPVNGKKVPIWIADYVVAAYGTGAVMGVPGSDHRDFAFAKKYGLPIIRVIGKDKNDVSSVETEEQVLEEGALVNSGEFSGLKTPDPAKRTIIEWLEKKGFGKKQIQYHLRDWLISRQRYWGPPIPMIHCEKCGWQPVPEEDLPILLPDVEDWRPEGTGRSPLANHPEFYQTTCPKCGKQAQRETDVSDTFLDSSWYFFRYTSTEIKDKAFDKGRVKKWLPVDMYIGGAEHSVLHLLYSRFTTMVFKDLDLIGFDEPYKKFRAHGLIIAEGAKMSKSKGNVVIPDKYINQYGADTLRLYLMFMAPFTDGGDFRDAAVEGIYRFLKRVWQITQAIDDRTATKVEKRVLNQTIKKVTEDIESLHYNTAISALMELLNFISRQGSADQETIKSLLILLAPFAPHMAEELFSRINTDKNKRISADNQWKSIHQQVWPSYDPQCLVEEEVVIVLQVNGKLRDTLRVRSLRLVSGQAGQASQKKVEQKARASDKVKKYLEGKTVKKVVYVEGKILNFVTS